MGVRDQINAVTGVNRNPGIARIQRNRIARSMVDRIHSESAGARNIGATL